MQLSFMLMKVIHPNLTITKYHLLIKYITSQLSLKNSSLLDYGSGNGDLLFYFISKFKLKKNVSIDISVPLINLQKKYLYNTKFLYPKNLNKIKKNSIDNTIVVSIMQYFQNYKYSKKILTSLISKTKKYLLLCDVKDKNKISKLKKSIQKRYKISEAEFEEKYKSNPILGYTKKFFSDSNYSFDVKIEKK